MSKKNITTETAEVGISIDSGIFASLPLDLIGFYVSYLVLEQMGKTNYEIGEIQDAMYGEGWCEASRHRLQQMGLAELEYKEDETKDTESN